ncbi:methionine synthase II (cobalamin-independent) [Arthrobacter stackebrandtii]|uniref:Methionine synthase II (Cobalamin-independent) n=1 Tax=Arthrobacter stackebrandtii TaxID=272161 RepID=A0ABS4YVQ8_9MICC|nr:hypothetical protein [Arthrobacter stackebrandtii]MBP2412892.1 methionine synthase II (cobalamin-independent) [Arthrobacter stackebrandtii]PYH01300.1 hypothetical protein CVV67_06990 [Arthrobacter stackebrandtii]
MTTLPAVHGAHLVGSINQPAAKDTFAIVAENLGVHAARIPDGEVGERFHWILFQGTRFAETPGLSRVAGEPFMIAGFDLRKIVLDGTVPAAELVFGPLGYAEAALASYRDFTALRDAGSIAPGTRFQVAIPSPLAPLGSYVAASDQAAVYPAYAAAMEREIAEIAAGIPAEDLAIQIDLAVEFSHIEQVPVAGNKPDIWYVDGDNPATEAIIDAATTLAADIAAAVPADVQFGIHLCYGDVAEKHFAEPADAGHLTEVANALSAKITRPIAFLHLPVPIERDDAAYFAPLAGLALHAETELFLGLVHHEDGVAGAAKRIAAARPAVAEAGFGQFGIATECGFGRGPAERTAPLLRLHAEIIAAAN